MDQYEEEIVDREIESVEDSESEENFELDDEEEIIKYEGFLYKLIDKKMRKLFFKLVHKDLFFYKDKNDLSHRGMHNLSGLFIKVEEVSSVLSISHVVLPGVQGFCLVFQSSPQ